MCPKYRSRFQQKNYRQKVLETESQTQNMDYTHIYFHLVSFSPFSAASNRVTVLSCSDCWDEDSSFRHNCHDLARTLLRSLHSSRSRCVMVLEGRGGTQSSRDNLLESLYLTQDIGGCAVTVLYVPNSQMFYKIVRRSTPKSR